MSGSSVNAELNLAPNPKIQNLYFHGSEASADCGGVLGAGVHPHVKMGSGGRLSVLAAWESRRSSTLQRSAPTASQRFPRQGLLVAWRRHWNPAIPGTTRTTCCTITLYMIQCIELLLWATSNSTLLALMDYQKRSNGWITFFEHWNIAFIAITTLVTGQVLGFLMRLNGAPWIWFFFASFAFMITGGGLLAYAKLPAYRSGRFFTFGRNSVPEELRGFYRWGWRVFIFGVVLSLCLLMSKP